MLETMAFDVNDIPSKYNLKLTIPTDVELKFRECILRYADKCSKEIHSYLIECGMIIYKISIQIEFIQMDPTK